VVLPFTVAFARTPARDFEGMLFDRAAVRAVVVGRDYTYGAQRAGTVSTLTAAAMARVQWWRWWSR
jgi:riboflavin kinase/FMN adenylyltransferase